MTSNCSSNKRYDHAQDRNRYNLDAMSEADLVEAYAAVDAAWQGRIKEHAKERFGLTIEEQGNT